MAARRSFYAQTAPTSVRRAFDYEIADDQELASSQPISLIQLCRTNASRNKAIKKLRNFHSDSEDVPGNGPVPQFTEKQEHFSRLPFSGYSHPPQLSSSINSGTLAPLQFVPQEYEWGRNGSHNDELQEQEARLWPGQSDYHAQKNPLSYASHYNASQSRDSGYMTESPFMRKSDWEAPSLHLYRDNYDLPGDRSPYESVRLKQRPNRGALPEITSGLHFGVPPDQSYERPTQTMAETRGGLTNPDESALRSRLSSGTSISQRTLKEEIYAILENMNLNSQADSQPTVLSDSQKRPACAQAHEPSQELQATSSVDEVPSREASDDIKDEGKEPEALAEDVTQTAARTSVTASDAIPEKTIRPPPGLSKPEKAPSFDALDSRLARLYDANTWFHRDSRGEEQLRRHIANIAGNFVDRSERLRGSAFPEQDRLLAERTILLFGNAIANLHAYNSSNKGGQTDYFASFNHVETRYCEPVFEKRRSYFEF